MEESQLNIYIAIFLHPYKNIPNLDVYICLLAYNFSGQGFYMFFMTSLAVLQWTDGMVSF